MAPWLLFIVAPALLFIYVAYTFVAAYWRLRNFNGPKIAAWTDLYFLNLSVTGRQHVILSELVDEYGGTHQLT